MARVSFEFKRRDFIWGIPLVLVLLIAVVIAYGGSEPVVMGHSADEIEGVCLSDGTGCDVDKAYVDGAIGGVFEPAAYTGGESVTFPNGLIMKMMKVSFSSSWLSRTITFDTAFPNGVVTVVCNNANFGYIAGDRNAGTDVGSITVSSFRVYGYGDVTCIATGY